MNYRGFTCEELEWEYSPSAMIGGDISPYLNAYAALSAKARSSLGAQENIRYGAAPENVLDFFPSSQPDAPLHVFVHGGYWQALSQKESAMMAASILDRGHAFATINYTIAPKARLGEMVKECCDALIFIAKEAAKLGIDPKRVTVSGHSAGAHLVAMVLSKYSSELMDCGLKISDAILISGVFDLEPISLVSVNEPLSLTQQEISDLSPLQNVPPIGPNFHVKVAERDTAEFIRQSRDYAEHFRKSGRSVTFELMSGLHHFDIVLHEDTFVAKEIG